MLCLHYQHKDGCCWLFFPLEYCFCYIYIVKEQPYIVSFLKRFFRLQPFLSPSSCPSVFIVYFDKTSAKKSPLIWRCNFNQTPSFDYLPGQTKLCFAASCWGNIQTPQRWPHNYENEVLIAWNCTQMAIMQAHKKNLFVFSFHWNH